MGELMGAIIVMGLVLGIYLAPALVAHGRQHPDLVGIFLLNLFTGWSVIGWVAAFAWALIPLGGGQSE